MGATNDGKIMDIWVKASRDSQNGGRGNGGQTNTRQSCTMKIYDNGAKI